MFKVFHLVLCLFLSDLNPIQNSAQTEYKILFECLGQKEGTKKVQNLLKSMPCKKGTRTFYDCYYYTYMSCGISLRFDSVKTLTTVFLMSEGQEGYSQYKGKLPYGLHFNMGKKEILKLLGIPDYDGETFVEYQKKGLMIDFYDIDINDHTGKKGFLKLTLQKPGKWHY